MNGHTGVHRPKEGSKMNRIDNIIGGLIIGLVFLAGMALPLTVMAVIWLVRNL